MVRRIVIALIFARTRS